MVSAFTIAFVTVIVGVPAYIMGYIAGSFEPPDEDGAEA